MRYRIFQNEMFVGAFDDRPAFHAAYTGENPNSPMKGDKITFNNTQYVIKWYIEHDSQSFTENEFHEKENDWFGVDCY